MARTAKLPIRFSASGGTYSGYGPRADSAGAPYAYPAAGSGMTPAGAGVKAKFAYPGPPDVKANQQNS